MQSRLDSQVKHVIVTNYDAYTMIDELFIGYPVMSMSSTPSTVNVTSTPSGYIMSHEQFGLSTFTNNIISTLVLTNLPVNYDVVIDFIYIRLGNPNNCDEEDFKDTLAVTTSQGTELYECRGDNSVPSPLTYNTATVNYITLVFTTGASYVYDGFLLRYSCKLTNSIFN